MNDPADILELLDEYFDGKLTAEQQTRLRDFINADPKNAEKVVLSSFLHRNLRDTIAGRRNLENDYLHADTLSDAQILPAMEEETTTAEEYEPDPFVYHAPPPMSGPPRNRRVRPILAFAAMLILVATVAIPFLRSSNSLPKPTVAVSGQSGIATITTVLGADDASLAVGQHLAPGSFSLHTGLAQLTFDNGASIIVEAPVLLSLDSSSSIRLLSGKLTTHIPPAAVGFTVHAPNASVVDLGTEIGMDVEKTGRTHVEVFTGKAEVQLPNIVAVNDGNTRVLSPAMAVSISSKADSISAAAPEPLLFIRPAQLEVRAHAPDTPLLRWQAFSSQLAEDASLIAYYSADVADVTVLRNRAHGAVAQSDGRLKDIQFAEGRYLQKRSLQFNGKTSAVQVNIPGTSSRLTMAGWISVHSLTHVFNGLLMSDGNGNGQYSFHWYLHKNSESSVRLTLGVNKSGSPQVWENYSFPVDVLAQDVDRWHFIALTYDADAQRITGYLDGEAVGEQPLAHGYPLEINAAEIGNWRHGAPDRSRAFDGKIDELAFWGRVLSGDEIRALYQAGVGK